MTAPFSPPVPRFGLRLMREVTGVDGTGRLAVMRAMVEVAPAERTRAHGWAPRGSAIDDFSSHFG